MAGVLDTRELGVTVVGIAAVVFVACAYKLVLVVADVLEMRTWVATSALIERLEPSPGPVMGSLLIVYTYTNGQRTCRGSRTSILDGAGASDGDQFRDSFTQGKPVTIWVDPDERCRAVIDRSVPWVAVVLLAAGIVGTAAGILYIRKRSWRVK